MPTFGSLASVATGIRAGTVLSGSKRLCALDRCSGIPDTQDIYIVCFDQIVANLCESNRGIDIP